MDFFPVLAFFSTKVEVVTELGDEQVLVCCSTGSGTCGTVKVPVLNPNEFNVFGMTGEGRVVGVVLAGIMESNIGCTKIREKSDKKKRKD